MSLVIKETSKSEEASISIGVSTTESENTLLIGTTDEPVHTSEPEPAVEENINMDVTENAGPASAEVVDHPVHEKSGATQTIGNRSVAVQNVVSVELAMGTDDTTYQNVWQEAHKLYSAAPTRATFVGGRYTLHGRATLVAANGATRVQNGYTYYDPLLDAHTQIDNMRIIYGSSKVIDRFTLSQAPDLMRGGILSSRAIVDTLMARRKFSKGMAEGLSASFEMGMDRCDMSSLFLIGSLIEHQIDDLERYAMAPNIGQAPAGSINHLFLNPAPGELAANLAIGQNAIETGRFCVENAKLSRVDKRVMALISAGCNQIRTPPNQPRHFLEFVETPSINWTIWSDEPIGPDPAIGDLTAEEIRTSLLRLSVMLDARSDYVKGSTRAQTILRGELVRQELPPPPLPENDDEEPPPPRAPLNPLWMTALFEFDTISVYRGRDSNFLWRVLSLVQARSDDKYFVDDYSLVASLQGEEKVLCGLIVAAVLSSAGSVLFHSLNFSGAAINTWGNPDEGVNRDAAPLLQAIFSIPPDADKNTGTITYFSMIVGAISQYTTFRLHPAALATPQFCGDGIRLERWGEGVLWQAFSGAHMPYIVDVISVMWAWTKWPDVWALSSPAGYFDVSDELQYAGLPQLQGLEMRYGDRTYDEVAMSVRPYKYVPYGGFVYNVVHQHFRQLRPLPIHFGRILKQGAGIRETFDEEPTPMGDNYWAQIYCLIPGRLPTYDWANRAVMVPRLLAVDMPIGMWESLSSGGRVESPYTGIRVMSMQTNPNIQTGAAALAGLVKGYNAGGGDMGSRESAGRRSEN